MKNRIAIPFVLVLAMASLAVAGCGGDDEEPTTSTEATPGATGGDGVALSAEEFLEEGNAICAAGNRELDQLARETFTGEGQPSPEEVEQFASGMIPSIQGQIDAIRALSPPEELAADVEEFLSTAEESLGELEDDPQLLLSEDEGPFVETNEQAAAIGLTECAG